MNSSQELPATVTTTDLPDVDPRFVFDLRNGRDPRPETVARVRAYLEEAQC